MHTLTCMFTPLLSLTALAAQRVAEHGGHIDVPFGVVDDQVAVFNPAETGSLLVGARTYIHDYTVRALGEAAARNAQRAGFEVVAVRTPGIPHRDVEWADAIVEGDDAREYVRQLRTHRKRPLVLFVPELDGIVFEHHPPGYANAVLLPKMVAEFADLMRVGPDFGVHVVAVIPRLWERLRADLLAVAERVQVFDLDAGFGPPDDVRMYLIATRYGESNAMNDVVFAEVGTIEAVEL